MSATTTVVIFGGTGDLAQRKLMPALFNLCCKGLLPQNPRIVSLGRRERTDQQYRESMWEAVKEYGDFGYHREKWELLASGMYYVRGDLHESSTFDALKAKLAEIESGHEEANRLYYLSIPPQQHGLAVESLRTHGLNAQDTGWRRVVVEKPFGHDEASAHDLNRTLATAFDERQTFRIDHYLGKETVQNLLIFRFANAIFEPLWDRWHIDDVQITVAESGDVGNRAEYYESTGVVRDMVQNHLLQLLSIVAMEAPESMDAADVRGRKADVVKDIRRWESTEFTEHAIAGQYAGYRETRGVAKDSRVPTYAALRLFVDNPRWQGVPFYLRSGKALANKVSEVVVNFKQPALPVFANAKSVTPEHNAISMCIQPDEGIHLRFQTKVPDQGLTAAPRELEFHYETAYRGQRLPEAYERLLEDALNGDTSLFIRGDWVEQAWNVVDPLLKAWEAPDAPPPVQYERGTWGPIGADELLSEDGHAWTSLCVHERDRVS